MMSTCDLYGNLAERTFLERERERDCVTCCAKYLAQGQYVQDLGHDDFWVQALSKGMARLILLSDHLHDGIRVTVPESKRCNHTPVAPIIIQL